MQLCVSVHVCGKAETDESYGVNVGRGGTFQGPVRCGRGRGKHVENMQVNTEFCKAPFSVWKHTSGRRGKA